MNSQEHNLPQFARELLMIKNSEDLDYLPDKKVLDEPGMEDLKKNIVQCRSCMYFWTDEADWNNHKRHNMCGNNPDIAPLKELDEAVLQARKELRDASIKLNRANARKIRAVDSRNEALNTAVIRVNDRKRKEKESKNAYLNFRTELMKRTRTDS
jgi:hypothetical protein